MNARIPAVACAAVLLTACTAMLPRGSSDAPSPFATFAEAQAAAEKIVPFQTPTGQLATLGFDPKDGRNVTMIPYPDIVARLAPYSGVPLEQLDPGIRTCILAKTECRGYVFRFEKEDRTREGGFWADFLNVKRETHVRGWWFEALVVVNDGTVLFRNISGQPHVERLVRERNPLGPLQPAGEGAGAIILR
ncbi:MAG TPA: hypothetical protein VGD76_03310 [Ramlibacter sp.]